MEKLYTIVDQLHDAWGFGEFQTLPQAVAELERLAAIPWGTAPNVAPCIQSLTCGRVYAILENGADCEMAETPYLQVMAEGVTWLHER